MTARTEVPTTIDDMCTVIDQAKLRLLQLRQQNRELRAGLMDLRDTLFASLSPSHCPSREQICDALAAAAVLIAKEEL